jgi:CheY-like chemotaxis protein
MVSRKKRVLVVDDDMGVVRTVKDLLQFEGYSVTTAKSAEEALEMVTTRGLKPDIIVLDIGMPGMGGMGFLNKIKEHDHLRFPVLVLTARSGIQAFLADTDVPVSGFLMKPCTEQELLDEIKHILAIKPELSTSGKARNIRVLIGEGDRIISRAIEESLKQQGYHVLQARSGPDVVEMAAASSPAVIAMNQVLPRLNGSEAANVIATMPDTRSIPVILYGEESYTTAHRTRPTNVKRCVTLIRPEDVTAAVEALMPEAE